MTEHLPEYFRFFQQVVQKWKNELVLFISSTELPLVIIGFKIRAFEDFNIIQHLLENDFRFSHRYGVSMKKTNSVLLDPPCKIPLKP